MGWKDDTIWLSQFGHTYSMAGYSYKGLGIYQAVRPSPKGRRPPTWSLVHLNTGHRVVNIEAPMREALEIAFDIAECTDWTFDGLDGWRNIDPEMPAKVGKIMKEHPKAIKHRGSGSSHADAQAVLAIRQSS